MAQFATMGDLDVWYARLDVDEAVAQWQQEAKKADRRRLEKNLEKARNKGSLRALKKLTETVDGQCGSPTGRRSWSRSTGWPSAKAATRPRSAS